MTDAVKNDLVFDVGAHHGEDSAYYLSRGYRVVAVECDPGHVRHLRARFASEIGDGRLVLVDKAVAPQAGPLTFFRNRNISVWGTALRGWADRNIREGTEIEEIAVDAVAPGELFQAFGMPHYLKIDVEGMDLVMLRSLAEFEARPGYVSIESSSTSFADLVEEFRVFKSLGYDRFKLSPQHLVRKMKVPPNSVHGTAIDYTFEPHASGLFGEDLPGLWIGQREAIAEYKGVFILYDLYDAVQSGMFHGDIREFRKKYGHDAGGWYDTHARHRSVAS